ncbi:hypothetical protein UY3_03348 [Chelonia mydas]|uniref:Uncharacterized protein n=1 Tax=Chelonia mydas TaxID=8469 RepID=M7CEY9_CHEMY|nr:hypothetical protein UY3_03348 [Chelonia mydas]
MASMAGSMPDERTLGSADKVVQLPGQLASQEAGGPDAQAMGEAVKRDGTLLPLSKGGEHLSRPERALTKVGYNPWGSVAELQKRVQTWQGLLDLYAEYETQKGKRGSCGVNMDCSSHVVSNVVGQKEELGKREAVCTRQLVEIEQLEAQITNQAATQAYAQDKLQALRQNFRAEKEERTCLEALAKQVPVLQGLVKDLTIRAQHPPQRQCAHHEKKIVQLKRQLAVHSVQVASLTGDDFGDPCEGFELSLCEDPQFQEEPCCTPIAALIKTKERSSR